MSHQTTNNENINVDEIPVKMFFSQSKIKSDVIPKQDTSTAYIIFQNNELHTKLDSLKQELVELNAEKEEQEQEIDSLTRSRTCLQGYVKNEYELSQSWKLIANSSKSYIKTYEKYWAMYCVVNIFCIIIINMVTNNQLRLTIIALYIPINFGLNAKEIYKLKHKIMNDELIKNAEEQIIKIDKGNSYIQELIDNM